MSEDRRRVLVVEDNFLVAASFEEVLTSASFSVVGPFARVAEGEAAIGNGIACAVLDINVRDGSTVNFARRLIESGTPVLFVSGYGKVPESRGPDDPVLTAPRLTKPVDPFDLITEVARLCGRDD